MFLQFLDVFVRILEIAAIFKGSAMRGMGGWVARPLVLDRFLTVAHRLSYGSTLNARLVFIR